MTGLRRTDVVDHYEVLEVSQSAASQVIKAAYRRLVKINHPDAGGNPAVFRRIQAAYECLSDPVKRALLDSTLGNRASTSTSTSTDTSEGFFPLDEMVEVDGIEYWLTYEEQWASVRPACTVRIRESDLKKIQELPVFSPYPVGAVIIMADDWETEIHRGYSFDNAKYAYERAKRELHRRQREEAARRKIVSLNRRLTQLKERGLPVTRLAELIEQASEKVDPYYSWLSEAGEAVAALRAVESEIERLSGDPAEVILSYFMAGHIEHRDILHNLQVMAKLEAAEIRSNGFIQAPTDDDLRAYYEKRLRGVSTLDDLALLDLRFPMEEYLPGGILADLEEAGELAPEMVSVKARKGFTDYRVEYEYREVDGVSVPTGTIRVPVSTFERNAAEYGRKSSFPVLPFNIQLFIIVTINDDKRVVAAGLDGESLARKVAKFQRGTNRGEVFSPIDEYGRRRKGPVEGTTLPPWYRGRRPR